MKTHIVRRAVGFSALLGILAVSGHILAQAATKAAVTAWDDSTLLSTGALDPKNGVKCPDDYNPDFNQSTKVLRCWKDVMTPKEDRKSVCPFGCGGLSGCSYNDVTNGKDTCKANSDGATIQTVPENTFDPQNYSRLTENRRLDLFRKGGKLERKHVYAEQR
ncbi:MAG: hypothetical protein WD690_09475 [Vicinamibacterales bacterium]